MGRKRKKYAFYSPPFSSVPPVPCTWAQKTPVPAAFFSTLLSVSKFLSMLSYVLMHIEEFRGVLSAKFSGRKYSAEKTSLLGHIFCCVFSAEKLSNKYASKLSYMQEYIG